MMRITPAGIKAGVMEPRGRGIGKPVAKQSQPEIET